MPDHASINPGASRQSSLSSRNKRRWPFLMGGLFLLLQGCATTPSVSPSEEARIQAKIAYMLSDYQRTLAIVLPRAEAGEPWAQYTLGYMYYYGRGIAQDRQTAKRWIESAAAKGYGPAQQAMRRLSAPSPRTEEEDHDISKQGPAGEDTTAPPAEQVKPINPQMTEPSPPAPKQETTPSAPTIEPPSTTTPPPHQDDTAPEPRNEPEQAPGTSPPSPDPIPPRTSIPSSDAEAASQSSPAPSLDKGIKGGD